jgi:pimeloyl-ACP methyl ester carboxylesterase
MTLLQLEDTSLDYVDDGRGDPIVFVHGSMSDRRSWDAPIAHLAERFRVIAYSRRYHWPNSRIASGMDYSMQQHVDDLHAVIDRLGIAPAHVVGHSYGALVGLLLAMQRPAVVRSLVLGEPPALTLFTSDPPKPTEILRLLFSRPATALQLVKLGATAFGPAKAAIRRGDPDEAFRRFGTAVLGQARFDNLSVERREQARTNFCAAEVAGSGYLPLPAAEVRSVQSPVLLVAAEHSPRVFHRFIGRLAELLPNARRIHLQRACHLLHEDEPTAYADAIVSFLSPSS